MSEVSIVPDAALAQARAVIETGRPLRVLSLGAGVQSTALLILSARGKLPLLDFAIFSDTGWEPREVYDHLDRLEREVAAPAGITILRVSNGNIREDALSADKRVAMIPLFTREQCSMCAGAKTVTNLTVFSPGEDLDEDSPGWLRRFVAKLHAMATPPQRYSGPCPRCDGTGVTLGRTRRQCTRDYKLVPINRAVRLLCGARPRVDGVIGQPPAGVRVGQWIGFSVDEKDRALDAKSPSYVDVRFPLLGLNLSRNDCDVINAEAGHADTVKSACIGCPNKRNDLWRDLRDNHPDDWDDAVDFDRRIRGGSVRAIALGHPLRGEAFLHDSRLPLDQAPIGHVTRNEGQRMQGDVLSMLSAMGVSEAMRSDAPVYGCGPYTCPSGESIEDDEMFAEVAS